jgi:hypothetical protein
MILEICELISEQERFSNKKDFQTKNQPSLQNP